MLTRRELIAAGAVAAGGAALLNGSRQTIAAQAADRPVDGGPGMEPGRPGVHYTPVITPNGAALPWKAVDGVKVYHLICEEVEHEFAPGLRARCWGFNGRVHGPTIEAVEGDRVRIYVTNRLPAPTAIHWHGVFLPCGMDGVGGVTQKAILPGETFKYEWTFRQHGTFMYHSHHDEMTQMALGMLGMLIVHPRKPRGPKVDRDFAIMLSEWKILPGTSRPDPNAMSDFNILTMNARCFPGTEPLTAKLGERVRIRFGNLGAMDHHSIHLHGYAWRHVANDGGDFPETAVQPGTTVLVPVGSTQTVEFDAVEPGDWVMHCHMTHHVMNQMGHEIPNMIGMDPVGLDRKIRELIPGYMTMGHLGMGDMGEMDMPVPRNSIPMVGAKGPFDYITMGGMFTIVKVRKDLADYKDPGWYKHPAGEVTGPAGPEQLKADGIVVPAGARRAPPARVPETAAVPSRSG
jgi:FtsP/CotA-like multicopper oxidase with cupredoxin domain